MEGQQSLPGAVPHAKENQPMDASTGNDSDDSRSAPNVPRPSRSRSVARDGAVEEDEEVGGPTKKAKGKAGFPPAETDPDADMQQGELTDLVDYPDDYYNDNAPRTAPPVLGSELTSARVATPALDGPPASVLTMAVTTPPAHVYVPPPRGGKPAAPTYSQAAKGKAQPHNPSSTRASAPAPTPTADLHALAQSTAVLTQKASIISELLQQRTTAQADVISLNAQALLAAYEDDGKELGLPADNLPGQAMLHAQLETKSGDHWLAGTEEMRSDFLSEMPYTIPGVVSATIVRINNMELPVVIAIAYQSVDARLTYVPGGLRTVNPLGDGKFDEKVLRTAIYGVSIPRTDNCQPKLFVTVWANFDNDSMRAVAKEMCGLTARSILVPTDEPLEPLVYSIEALFRVLPRGKSTANSEDKADNRNDTTYQIIFRALKTDPNAMKLPCEYLHVAKKPNGAPIKSFLRCTKWFCEKCAGVFTAAGLDHQLAMRLAEHNPNHTGECSRATQRSRNSTSDAAAGAGLSQGRGGGRGGRTGGRGGGGGASGSGSGPRGASSYGGGSFGQGADHARWREDKLS